MLLSFTALRAACREENEKKSVKFLSEAEIIQKKKSKFSAMGGEVLVVLVLLRTVMIKAKLLVVVLTKRAATNRQ